MFCQSKAYMDLSRGGELQDNFVKCQTGFMRPFSLELKDLDRVCLILTQDQFIEDAAGI